MHCDEGMLRDGRGRRAPKRRFLWLLALAFCVYSGYIANVEVRASVAIQVAADVRIPVCRSLVGGMGEAPLELPMPQEAGEMPIAAVGPHVVGPVCGESH